MAYIEKHQEKSLGELLLQSGRISKDQLETALSEQERSVEPLGKTLIRLGMVEEKDVLQVLKGLLVVTFTLAKEEFAFEALYVREIIRWQEVNQLPRMPVYVEGLLRHREMVLPVVNLTRLLGHQPEPVTEDSRIIIVETTSTLYGLAVDAVEAVVQLPMDRIESTPSALKGLDPRYIYGVGKYTDRLITVLHLEKILENVRIQGISLESGASE